MTSRSVTRSGSPPRNRAIYWIGYMSFVVVTIRELGGRTGDASFTAAAALLTAILLLMTTDPILFRRWRFYPWVYSALQTGLIQALGLLQPYQDIWGLLYIFVGTQARYYLPVRAAVAWGVVSGALLVLVQVGAEATYGLGHGLTYIAGTVLVISWDVLSGQAEAARQESQALLTELQRANEELRASAAQVEAQAAIRERDRLSRELHDSVGQAIFAIALATESARILLRGDPAAVPAQLERLQDMTGNALSQMRSLITHWRPQ